MHSFPQIDQGDFAFVMALTFQKSLDAISPMTVGLEAIQEWIGDRLLQRKSLARLIPQRDWSDIQDQVDLSRILGSAMKAFPTKKDPLSWCCILNKVRVFHDLLISCSAKE